MMKSQGLKDRSMSRAFKQTELIYSDIENMNKAKKFAKKTRNNIRYSSIRRSKAKPANGNTRPGEDCRREIDNVPF